MAVTDSVLRHAITPAAFDENMCHRERLVDTLHANIPRKLIIIAAPPGYGKTTLLADFTENTELPVCWVRLTDADQDVMRLATVLAASLKKKFRRLRNELELESYAGAKPEEMVSAFVGAIDEHVSETFVIAFDDVHLINHSKDASRFLDSFLNQLPDQVTVIAAGREVLEVSLAKLMAEGDLAGLGPHDLALTREEVVEVARLHSGIELNDDEASELLTETRGWVTGAILSGELASSNLASLVGNARPMVYEYLASVVLNRQPDDLRRFMLDSSVFPVMTSEACDAVLGLKNSGKFLQQLVQKGLFITATNESPRTYEYHPQLRGFLLQLSQSADPDRLHGLQSKAAAFLAEQGSPEYAVQLYCDAGDFQEASELAESWSQHMFQQGRYATLESWINRLEQHHVPLPRVQVSLAQFYSDQGRIDSALDMLDKARTALPDDSPFELRVTMDIVQAHIDVKRGAYQTAIEAVEKAEAALKGKKAPQLLADCKRFKALAIAQGEGDLERSETLAREAIDLLEEVNATYNVATALIDLSNIQAALGKKIDAQASTRRAHAFFEEFGAPLPLASSNNNLAYDAHHAGQYQDALRLYSSALKYARQAGSASLEASILFGQADLFADLDLALQAAELYGQGLNLAVEIDNIALIQYGCVQTSILHRRRKGYNLAYEWLKRAISLEDGDPHTVQIQLQMGALDALNQPHRAVEGLTSLLESGRLSIIEETLTHYFLARAALQDDDMEGIQKAFGKALELAGAGGAEQAMAGEIQSDDRLRKTVQRQFASNPVYSVVTNRISTMQAIMQQYQKTDDEADSVKEIRLIALGEMGIYVGGESQADLKPLAREVLFYITDHGDVERDHLLEVFWPHHPPGRQMANLHTATYSLRRALGKEAITHEGTIYSLNPELSLTYDVARFERAAALVDTLPMGDPRRLFALTEAINSYGGKFLVEFAGDWVLERRRDLEILYLDLLAQHAEEALIRDEPERAVSTLRQALQIDPLRDDTNLHFLEALGRLGRRSELVEHYQQYMRRLSDELGLDPPEEVRKIYTRLIE